MSQNNQRVADNQQHSIAALLSAIGWPVLIGLASTSLFYALIFRGPLNVPVMHRYFASHPVTYAESTFFFIGLAALLLKLAAVVGEYRAAGKVDMPGFREPAEPLAESGRLLDRLYALPPALRESYLGRRLRDALEFVERSNSAENLGDELKYLADVEAARQQDSYALVRIVIWATPMLGFLGTVMGITEALGDLSANAKMLATAIDTAIQGLLGGLYVAFDTTALALTLSMVLMFIQFLIDRMESQLLSVVDRQANEELVGRFQAAAAPTDPHVATIEKMLQAVIRSTEQLVQRQSLLWQGTIESAHDHWNRLFTSVGDQVQGTLAVAMERSLQSHAEQTALVQRGVVEQIVQQWEKVQSGLSEHALLLLAQQSELVKHGETMVKVLTATGDVMKLEQALNENLDALAGSKNFEDTVMSLSAAIHLLNTRLGKSSEPSSAVELTRSKTQGKAA